jgi:hypothetical protein
MIILANTIGRSNGIGRSFNRTFHQTFSSHHPLPYPPRISLIKEAHPFADICPKYLLQLTEVRLKYILFRSIRLSSLFSGRCLCQLKGVDEWIN